MDGLLPKGKHVCGRQLNIQAIWKENKKKNIVEILKFISMKEVLYSFGGNEKDL